MFVVFEYYFHQRKFMILPESVHLSVRYRMWDHVTSDLVAIWIMIQEFLKHSSNKINKMFSNGWSGLAQGTTD